MNPGRLILKSVALLAFVAAGCAWPQHPKPTANSTPVNPQSSNSSSPAESARKVDQVDATAGTADALARKTEAYTREMAPLINSRNAASPPPVPSGVQWMDPSQFRLDLTAHNSDSNRPASVQPVIESTPANANQASNSNPENPEAAKPHPDSNTAVAMATPSPRAISNASAPSSASVDALEQKFSQRVKDYPRDVSAQLEYQLLRFLLDEPEPEMSTLSSLPTEDRELITAVLDGLTNFRNALRADNNMLLSKKIKPILDLAERLRSQADLTIPTIALCTRVNGFGSYDPIDPARFPAERDNPVIVYCEIANFGCNLNDKQMWETRLTWDMTLYTEGGMSVWSDKTETIADTSRNRRHDFFVRKMITLPKSLTIGRYLLKVSIVDTQSNRVSEATVPIVIAAQ
jgi:hypothetical protein